MKRCSTVTCTGTNKLTLDGKCLAACPEFFEEDSAAPGKCKKSVNKCASEATNKLLIASTNTCVATGGCTRFLKEDLANNQCQTVTCAAGKVLKGDGTCVDKCPDYEFLSAGKCTIPAVVTGKTKLSIDGVYGAACPEFYEDLNADGKCTIFPAHTCGAAAPYQLGDKSCVAKCAPYTLKNDTTKRCETTVCVTGQKLKADGTCAATCPDYSAASLDGKKCETATCEGAAKLLKKDGACAKACPDYEVASADGKTCVAAPACLNKLTVTGACVATCPDFYKADTSANVKCIPITNVCAANSDGRIYMKKDGVTCVAKCDDYNEAKNNQCHEVTCPVGAKYRTLGGKCLAACPQLTTAAAG